MVKKIATVYIKLVGSKKGVPILSEFNWKKFSWRLIQLSLGVVLILTLSQLPGFAGDIENKLSTDDGSTTFEVKDSGDSVISQIDSDGNTVIKGTMTVEGSALSVGTSTLVITGGSVGIGTTVPEKKLHIRGVSDSADTVLLIDEPVMGSDSETAKLILRGSGIDASIRHKVIGGNVALIFNVWSGDRMVIQHTGNVGIGTTNPTAKLDVNGSPGYNQVRMRTSYTPTGTGDTNGNVGDIAWDDSYIYIKTSAGWKRTALSTW